MREGREAAGEGLAEPREHFASLTLSEEREKVGWKHPGLASSSGSSQAKAGRQEAQ